MCNFFKTFPPSSQISFLQKIMYSRQHTPEYDHTALKNNKKICGRKILYALSNTPHTGILWDKKTVAVKLPRSSLCRRSESWSIFKRRESEIATWGNFMHHIVCSLLFFDNMFQIHISHIITSFLMFVIFTWVTRFRLRQFFPSVKAFFRFHVKIC